MKLTAPAWEGLVQGTDRMTIIHNNVCLLGIGHSFYIDIFKDYSIWFNSNARIYNNTSYKMAVGFQEIGNENYSRSGIYRNNISVSSTTSFDHPYDWLPQNVYISYPSIYTETNNTWDATQSNPGYPGYTMTDTVIVTEADFVESDSAALVAIMTAPRQADGTLPATKPLTLAAGSDLIDAGIEIPSTDTADVSIAFSGDAPDIGWAEYAVVIEVDSIHVGATGSATTIETDNGTLQMLDTIWPDTASYQSVTWSVIDGTGSATINQSGLVTAVTDGTVTIRATAQDGTDIYGEYGLTISNQDAYTLPTIITSVTSQPHSVQAICGGNATADGGAAITAKGICWSTSSDPTLSDSYTVDGSGTGVFVSTMYGLENSTLYYVRAYATNSEGTRYGDNRQVTTTAYSTLRTGAGKTYRLNGKTIVY